MSETLLNRVVSAYGGEARWKAAAAVEASFSAGGLLFRWKRGRDFRDLHLRAETAAPRAWLRPIDADGNVGVLDGQSVRIETPGGAVLASRSDPRRRFPYGRRLIRWDPLDLVYFLGYAMWNYSVLPALLLREDIEWSEISKNTLEGRFPPHLPTHCEYNRYHFDPATNLLRRYDYTAEVFGGWAKAGHVVLEHGESEGIPFPLRRRVLPRMPNGEVMPFPLLIRLDVYEFRLV